MFNNRFAFWVVLTACLAAPLFSVSAAAQAGLVANYTFDEGTGTIVHDTSGNANDGTFVGNPTWAPGLINSCLSFDGSTQYVQIPHSASIDPITGWTLAAFIRRTSINAQHSIIESYSSSGGNYAMRILDSNVLSGNVLNNPQNNQALNGTTIIRANQWYHVALTFDAASGKFTSYVNGNLENTSTIPFAAAHSSVPVYIGARGDDAATKFAGKIDDARIYNRALDISEIKALAAMPPVAVADSYSTPIQRAVNRSGARRIVK